MTDGDQRVEPAGWPPPHPSPPLPPLRGSGVPGAPPSRAPYVAGLAVALLVLALATVLVLVLTGGEDPQQRAAGAEPSASASASASSEPAAPAGATCWDESPADAVEDCSEPEGLAGLRWVFPAMADDRCGTASTDAGGGVVTRVLCLHRFSDGTRAQVGYFEWASVEQGSAFYDAQGLTSGASADYVTWVGGSGGQAKTAVMYAAAPFSVTVTYPSSRTPPDDQMLRLAPRPPGELRGLPNG